MRRPLIVLQLSASGLCAWQKSGHDWQNTCRFVAGGEREFPDWLASRNNAQFVLLVDLAGERWLLDEIPPLSRRDRQALLAQRLARHFPGQTLPYQALLAQHAVFAAIERSALSPWLEALYGQESLLQAIVSPALLAPQLLKQLGQSGEIALLVLCFSEHFLALAVVGGQTLNVLRQQHASPNMSNIAASCSRLRSWLIGQRFLSAEASVSALLVGTPADEVVADVDGICFVYLEQDALSLCLDTASLRRQRMRFGAGACYQAERRALWARVASLSAFLALLISLTYSIGQFKLYQEISAGRQLVATAESALATGPAKEPVSLRQNADILQQAAALDRLQVLPQALLEILAQALDRHPEIELDSLDWQNDAGSQMLELSAWNHGAPGEREKFLLDLRVDRGILLEPLAQAGEAAPNISLRLKHSPPP